MHNMYTSTEVIISTGILCVFHVNGICVIVASTDPEQDLGLSLDPLDPSYFTGQSFLLSCSVEEPADFTWTFDDGPLPSNVAVMQDSPLTSVLVLSDVNLENAGAYTCKANNTARGVVNGDTSYLTVTGECIL